MNLKAEAKGSHPSRTSREKLTPKEKEFLTNNLKRGGGLVVYENVRNKWEWIKWAKKLGVCIKCAEKGHRSAECTADKPKSDKKPKKLLNTVVQDNSIDSEMEPDLEYLGSMTNRGDFLLMYHYEINVRDGTVLLDTRAMKNYISRRFAEAANLKFKGTAELRSVRLPNGQDMKVLGQCEFKLGMSEWTGTVHMTVLDLQYPPREPSHQAKSQLKGRILHMNNFTTIVQIFMPIY